MKETRYTFNFKGGPVVVWALNEREARTLARIEAIRRGWDNTIIEKEDKDADLKRINEALKIHRHSKTNAIGS